MYMRTVQPQHTAQNNMAQNAMCLNRASLLMNLNTFFDKIWLKTQNSVNWTAHAELNV